MHGQPGHITRADATQFFGHRCKDALTPERTFDSQATWAIDVLALLDMLSMGACTTRYWQTSGRLVQELNDCNVPVVHIQNVKCNSSN